MQPLPLVVYGSTACEDTALAIARLRALDIPFTLHNRETDSDVAPLLEKYNHGAHSTPTLVLGKDEVVFTEPTLEELETNLRGAGYRFETPRAIEIRGAMKNQRVPNFTLPSSNGGNVTLYKLGGFKRAVLFFVNDPKERASQGYARQLTSRADEFQAFNALPLPVVAADAETTKHWAHEFARDCPALSDRDASVNKKYAALFNLDPVDALLLILDSYCAPRALSHAPDAGGLISPTEILEWLRLLDCECDE